MCIVRDDKILHRFYIFIAEDRQKKLLLKLNTIQVVVVTLYVIHIYKKILIFP